MNEHRNTEAEPKKIRIRSGTECNQGLEDQNTLFYSSDERIDRTPHRTSYSLVRTSNPFRVQVVQTLFLMLLL